MQNKIITLVVATLSLLPIIAQAQENVYPAKAQSNTTAINNVTIHTGNGKVFTGAVQFTNGKITQVTQGTNLTGTTVIDGTNQHLYPGLIATSTNLGLVEVSSVRATQDYAELGDINPNIQSITAYNTDSKVINTLRTNGVLLAHIVPQGGTLSGASSVVQLDAWSIDDAAYQTNNGIHFNMPSLINLPNQFGNNRTDRDPVKLALERIETIRRFFTEAKTYQANNTIKNQKYEAVQGLFNQTQTLFVHCDLVKEMLMAIEFAKEFNFKLCLVGASDSWLIAPLLKQTNTQVILAEPHSLPNTDDDDVDQPYKTGAQLQKAGVTFSFCQDAGDGYWQQRNLPFQAGTMATYGLSKEEALTALTLNAAKILGIDAKTGSIEVGKDANLVLSTGDILDMKTNNITHAFIQGRKIDLNNKQTELYKKYQYKYGTK
jgi:imidazolonepropionase-like amidohydrolase